MGWYTAVDEQCRNALACRQNSMREASPPTLVSRSAPHSPTLARAKCSPYVSVAGNGCVVAGREIDDGAANTRVFEILACGAFQVVNRQGDVLRLFRDGEHLAVFSDGDDLRERRLVTLAVRRRPSHDLDGAEWLKANCRRIPAANGITDRAEDARRREPAHLVVGRETDADLLRVAALASHRLVCANGCEVEMLE